ncbi:TRAP transporter solute receptor, TAXI family [Moorella glycerini]|uniref:NMT1/THI5 like protein n=1 Tax=Neomoorella stamsii TaxID=1266720 RepID=A0A9X7J3P2_9FIRM|nr:MULTISPECIES: TAXI family TRAP transporter solute-binding subunit [Moorella]PRR73424.1 NMT1/THI5 like protein [Moorella stamsii]CEP69193.1 TRAP transporter solute receptor, TAXI family [Moorella glycerini]
MKKKVLIVIALLTLSFTFMLITNGCGGGGKATGEKTSPSPSTSSQASVQQISFATSQPGGVFYPLAVAMCDILNKNVPNVRAITEQTGGSVENTNLLMGKKAEIGFATDSVALEKYEGGKYFKYGWRLFEDTLEYIALADSGIKSIKDLDGKKVAVGAAGSAANKLTIDLLKAHGVKNFSPQYLEWEKSVDALLDHLIDATAGMGAYPIPAIQGVQARANINLLQADPEVIKANFKAPVYPVVIPAGTYKGQDKDVTVLGISAGAWIRSDLPEDLVYEITKAIFSNLDYLGTVHRTGKDQHLLTPEEAQALGVEVHPGVIKYAKEKGIWK